MKEKGRQRLSKKEVRWFKKDGTEHNSKGKTKTGEEETARKGEKERQTCLSLPSLCGMTSLCTAAVFVNQGQGCLLDNFLREEGGKRGREKKKKKKQEREKEGRELRH